MLALLLAPGFGLLPGRVAAGPPAGPVGPSAWRRGDGWPLLLTVSASGWHGREYNLHVVITGAQIIDNADCWRLDFIPINAAADLGDGYRVFLDKATGALRVIMRRQGADPGKPPEPKGLPFPLEPATAFPWEVLPLLGESSGRSTDGAVTWRVTSKREGKATWWEATCTEEGDAALVIKQKWPDAARWWSVYERWRDGVKELSATLSPRAAKPPEVVARPRRQVRLLRWDKANSLEDQKERARALLGPDAAIEWVIVDAKTGKREAAKAPEMVFPPPTPPPGSPEFTKDPRLRAALSVDLKGPTVPDVLERLHQATGVSFTMADNVTRTKPAFHSVNWRSVPAWEVMREVAESLAVQDHWEPAGEGYQLFSSIPAEDTAGRSNPLVWWGLGAAVLVGLALLAWEVRGRRRRKEVANDTKPG